MSKLTLKKIYPESRIAIWNVRDYNSFHSGEIDYKELTRRTIRNELTDEQTIVVECTKEPILVRVRRAADDFYAKEISHVMKPEDKDKTIVQKGDYDY